MKCIDKRPVYIYGLLDEFDVIRYIGKTVQKPEKRFQHHISLAKRGCKYYVYKWIRKMINVDKLPTLKILEECTSETFVEREKHYIATLPNLCNIKEGGETGRMYSDFSWVKEAVKKKRENIEKNRKYSILIFDTNKNFIKKYESRVTLCREFEISQNKLSNYIVKQSLFRSKYFIIYEKDYNKFIKSNKKHHRKIKITTFDEDLIFDKQSDAAIYLGVSKTVFNQILHNKTKNFKGYKICQI